MQATELMNLLQEMNIPVTNTDFPPNFKEDPPFLVFTRSDISRFKADNYVYRHENRYRIELYTNSKSEELEDKLIEILNKNNVVWTYVNDVRIQDGLYLAEFELWLLT